MEGVGITKALKNNQRIKTAAVTANSTESIHSRKTDFLFSDFTLVLTALAISILLLNLNNQLHFINKEQTNIYQFIEYKNKYKKKRARLSDSLHLYQYKSSLS